MEIIYAILVALTIFFFSHYVLLLFSLYASKKEIIRVRKRFTQLFDEYRVFSECISAYGRAETDEERLAIQDRINVNSATSILRDTEI